MAYGQSTLARKFADGDTSGTASNMAIRESDSGWTLLVGYGHAVYAARSPDGHVIQYDGWRMRKSRRHSGSQSTKSQFSKMRGIADTNVAYMKADTGGERATKENADHVTDTVNEAAPKASRWTPEIGEMYVPLLQ